MSKTNSVKVAIVGLGFQGTGIAELIQEHGYRLVGAVDVDDKVGKPLREFVPHPDTPDVPVFGSFQALLEGVEKPDVAVLAIAVPAEIATDVAADILNRGVNVITLTEALFEGLGELPDRLDKIARENGVSLIAGGLQDLMWVQLPAAAAAAVSHLSEVVLDDFGDTSIFPFVGGQLEAGMAMDEKEFAEWAGHMEHEPPIQGAPLRELAPVLGFHPTTTTYKITPFWATEPVEWPEAEMTIPVGKALGARFVVHIETEEGVPFNGYLIFKIAQGDEISRSSIVLTGRTTMRMDMPDLNPLAPVWLGVVRRIDDLMAAPPGVVRVSTLGIARYVHPTAAR